MKQTTAKATFRRHLEKNPCHTCSMIASTHYHTEEERAKFKFGCEGEKLDACRALTRLYRCGPPGYRGCPSNKSPTKEDWVKMRAEDELRMKEYDDKIQFLRDIMNDTAGDKHRCIKCGSKLQWGKFAYNQNVCFECFNMEVEIIIGQLDDVEQKGIVNHMLALAKEAFVIK